MAWPKKTRHVLQLGKILGFFIVFFTDVVTELRKALLFSGSSFQVLGGLFSYRVVFLLFFSFLAPQDMLAYKIFFPGPAEAKRSVSLLEEPKAACLTIVAPSQPLDSPTVHFTLDKTEVFKGTLAEFLKIFHKNLGAGQLTLRCGHVQAEVFSDSLLATSDRVSLAENIAQAVVQKHDAAQETDLSEQEVDLLCSSNLQKQVLRVFGAWDPENHLQNGGVRAASQTTLLPSPQWPAVRYDDRTKGRVWSGVRGYGEKPAQNIVKLFLTPGTVQIESADQGMLAVPFQIKLSQPSEAAASVRGVLVFWARCLGCLGENDLKGPLGKSVRRLSFFKRFEKSLGQQASIAERWMGRWGQGWFFQGHSKTGSFQGNYSKKLLSQHVVCAFNLGGVGVVLDAGQEKVPKSIKFLSMMPVGPDDRPKELSFSRMNTFKAPAYQPCPLCFSHGIRWLVGHQKVLNEAQPKK